MEIKEQMVLNMKLPLGQLNELVVDANGSLGNGDSDDDFPAHPVPFVSYFGCRRRIAHWCEPSVADWVDVMPSTSMKGEPVMYTPSSPQGEEHSVVQQESAGSYGTSDLTDGPLPTPDFSRYDYA